jgi:hypothetical protein
VVQGGGGVERDAGLAQQDEFLVQGLLQGQLHDVAGGSHQAVPAPFHLDPLYDVPIIPQAVFREACTSHLVLGPQGMSSHSAATPKRLTPGREGVGWGGGQALGSAVEGAPGEHKVEFSIP